MQLSPIRWACAFIIATNFSWLPATCCASAIAASLPEGSSNPYRRSSSFTFLPSGSSPTPEPEKSSARRVIITWSSGLEWATTTSAVIIFVRLAIGSRFVACRVQSTVPVRTSNTRPAVGCGLSLTGSVCGATFSR